MTSDVPCGPGFDPRAGVARDRVRGVAPLADALVLLGLGWNLGLLAGARRRMSWLPRRALRRRPAVAADAG